jgi:hypothetical protein
MQYWANTESTGWVSIGTFNSYADAYAFGVQRFGNDFLGISTSNQSGGPTSLSSNAGLIVLAALAVLMMSMRRK